MAVLSFAHLKKSDPLQRSPSVLKTKVAATDAQAGKSGVVSFAHLKKKKIKVALPEKNAVNDERQVLQRVSCLCIAKTARLVAINYCQSCPRFWPADENERENGVEYGRCKRSYDGWVEEWRIIPAGARVYQCSYHRGDDDRELCGPAPCLVRTWKIELNTNPYDLSESQGNGIS